MVCAKIKVGTLCQGAKKGNSLDTGEKGLKGVREKVASGPITFWEIDGETVEAVSDFIFGGSKLTCRW